MEHYKKQLDFVNIELKREKISTPKMSSVQCDNVKNVQYDSCLKWRELTYHPEQLDTNFSPSLWECKINWDSNFDRLA
jgi:hypothetical protein